MGTVKVVILPFGITLETEKGRTLYEVFLEAGVDITTICGGSGKCGKCRVSVDDPRFEATSSPTAVEKQFLSAEELSGGTRLACQVELKGSVKVNVPRESLNTRVRLQTEGIETDVEPSPLVRKFYSEPPEPTLDEVKPDFERLIISINKRENPPRSVSLRFTGLIPRRSLSGCQSPLAMAARPGSPESRAGSL